MSDYYEPTLLFRQNAIRRFNTTLSPIPSVESLCDDPRTRPDSLSDRLQLAMKRATWPNSSSHSSYKSWNKRSSWLFKNNPKDCQLLAQTCALDKLSIQSNYWKIPDSEFHMTTMAVGASNNTSSTLALASGAAEQNLFIYEYDDLDNYLVHHKTITLPHIHSMQWAPHSPDHLLTGNSKGYAHLVKVPGSDLPQEAAEIRTRLNHRKILRTKREGQVSSLGFLDEDVVSVFNNHLFRWDVHQKATPVMVSRIEGIMGYDVHSHDVLGVCGKFGASMYDMRQARPHVSLAFSKTCTSIKFNPQDPMVFAATYRDSCVKLFDARNTSRAYSELRGHTGLISALEWSSGDIFTGASDGNIVHWDLRDAHNAPVCGLKEGLDSVHFNPTKNAVERIFSQRQCGTILPASNTNIVAMGAIRSEDDVKVLSVDGSSFFGVHSKIHSRPGKAYYSNDDLRLMGESATTLVEIDLTQEKALVDKSPEIVELNDVHSVYSDASTSSEVKPLSIKKQRSQSMDTPSVSSDSPIIPDSPTHLLSERVISMDSDLQFFAHRNSSSFSLHSSDRTRDSDNSDSNEESLFNNSVESLSTMHTAVQLVHEFKGALRGLDYDDSAVSLPINVDI